MNKKSDGKETQKNQRIQVFARCRPLNQNEKKEILPSIVDVIPEKKVLLRDKNANREFYFDKVFAPDSSQITVYKSVVAPLIKEVMAGYNCTVFAYGQTGTGKTYTMEGERLATNSSWEDDPGAGIIPRSLHQLFEELNKEENVEFSVRVSFLELYNEELFDLLNSNGLSRLRLFEDSARKGSVVIQGLEEIMVNSKDEVYTILANGSARRKTAATLMNASSSRSHTVFSVTVHIKENMVNGEELLKTGKLNLVDLAGSENVGRSGAVDKRAREAGNINQSLLTLGRVITSLIEKAPHVPYRESKLTRLLQDSLGGHTKTSIIATISPAHSNLDETVSTLDYATKAKSITIKPVINQKMTKRALIKEYTEEIERLRKDLSAARQNSGYFIDAENHNALLQEIDIKTDKINALDDKIGELVEMNSKVEEQIMCLKNELNNKNAELYDLKVLFKKTKLDCDEKAFLIDVQRKIHKKLSEEAEILLGVVNQTTSDVSGLHAKIDRKRTTEVANEEQTQKFKVFIKEQLTEMHDMTIKMKNEQIARLESIEDDLRNCSGCIESNAEKYVECLNDFLLSFNTDIGQISSKLESEIDNHIEWSMKICNNLTSQHNAVSEEHKKFLNGNFAKCFDIMVLTTTSMKDTIKEMQNSLQDKIQSQKDILIQRMEEENVLLGKIDKTFMLFYEHHDDILQNIEKIIENEESNQSEQDQRMQDMLKIINEVMEGNKLSQNNVQKMKTNKTMLKEKITICKTSVDDSLKSSSHYVEERYKLNNNYLDNLCSSQDTKMLIADNESMKENQINLKAEVEQYLTQIEQTQNKNLLTMGTEFENYSSSLNATECKNRRLISDLRMTVDTKVQSGKELLRSKSKNLQSSIESTISYSKATGQKVNLVSDELDREILERDMDFEKFVSKDLVKDKPTGVTPQRQNYSFPRLLVSLSPEHEILSRYRSKLAEDMANAIDMPLNDSFESSGSKSEGSPLSAKTSLNNSDASDNTGFETDSSTVSWSDSTSTNKENQVRQKKCRIPKRKLQKPKGFLKPATPIRKPLLSHNSDISGNI